MSHLRILRSTAKRVLLQLRHDPRTVALMLVAPVMLTGLLAWIPVDQPGAFDRWGAILLGIFPLLVMFIVTSIATLRERTGGTLERLMTTPMAKFDSLGGYGLAFGAAAVVQAVVVSGFAFGLFGLTIAAPVAAVLLIAILDAPLGTSLGLFVSAFARTEFQAVQFLPALILPQLLLCGIVAPTTALPGPLEGVAAKLAHLRRARHAGAHGEPVGHERRAARHRGARRLHPRLRRRRRSDTQPPNRVRPEAPGANRRPVVGGLTAASSTRRTGEARAGAEHAARK